MLKCDPRVFSRCPYKRSCVSIEEACFTEGSDCDQFNQRVLAAPATKADQIRAMSDVELADFLLRFFIENMDANGIPHGDVTEGDKMELLKLLQQPAEGVAENE